jgi:hypothetical protein
MVGHVTGTTVGSHVASSRRLRDPLGGTVEGTDCKAPE